MLGFIRGRVLSKNADTSQCVILAHHMGYEVTVPRHVYELLTVGNRTELWLHTHVREDAFTLYGFALEAEKHLFRVLLSASGVGPKVALSLLTCHGSVRLAQAILSKDVDTIAEAAGVGKKLAQKIVLELNSKIEKLSWTELPVKAAAVSPIPTKTLSLRDELTSALENLAFHPSQVKATLDRLFERGEPQGFEAGLKAALQDLSGRGGLQEVNARA